MNAGIDTDFMVALTIAEHPDRPAALATRDRHLSRGDQFVLTAQVLGEFLHVVTDPRRFHRPLSMKQAIEKSRDWLAAAETLFVAPDLDVCRIFHEHMLAQRLGRKRILDTLLAATLIKAGVPLLITGNTEHYCEFEGLEAVDFRAD